VTHSALPPLAAALRCAAGLDGTDRLAAGVVGTVGVVPWPLG